MCGIRLTFYSISYGHKALMLGWICPFFFNSTHLPSHVFHEHKRVILDDSWIDETQYFNNLCHTNFTVPQKHYFFFLCTYTLMKLFSIIGLNHLLINYLNLCISHLRIMKNFSIKIKIYFIIIYTVKAKYKSLLRVLRNGLTGLIFFLLCS